MSSPAVANPLSAEVQSGASEGGALPSSTAPTSSDIVRKTILRTDNKYMKDPLGTRFYEGGVNFRAKLIGHEDVKEARGDDMCRESMIRLKAQIQVSQQHKQRIIINIDTNGLRIADELTGSLLHKHAVNHISFIARDATDARAFAYIYGESDGKHRFFAIKTEKPADNLVLTMRDLFQFIYELKKRQVDGQKNPEAAATADQASGVPQKTEDQKKQDAGLLFSIEENDLTTLQKNIKTVEQDFDTLALRENAPTVSQSKENPDDLFTGLEDSTTAPVDYAAKSSNIMNLFGPTAPAQPVYGVPQPGAFPQQQMPYGMVQPGFGAPPMAQPMQQPMVHPVVYGVQQPVMMGAMQQPVGVGMQPAFGAPMRPGNPAMFGQQPVQQQGTNPFGNSQDPFSMFENK